MTTMTETTNDRTIRFLGNNQIDVLVSSDETDGEYCVLKLTIQPGGGANALHIDNWVETFHVMEGQVDWTLERDGELVSWTARSGETVVVPAGVKHKFVGAGNGPSRLLTIGPSQYEHFFRALADAWSGPYDRERTPQAVGPVFQQFGMQFVDG